MTNNTARAIAGWRHALLCAAGVVAFITPVAVGVPKPPPQARTVAAPASLPAFEEVSVRPNVSEGRGGRGGGAFQPGRYVAQNVTLKTILRRAYGIDGAAPGSGVDLFEPQVAGGPSWVAEDKFDIIATTTKPTQPSEMRLMVQRMLAERFKLVAHWEKRELPVYVLTMARPGVLGTGLKKTSDEECAAAKAAGPPPMPQVQPGQPPPPLALPNCGGVSFGPGQLIARGAPMEFLATSLTTVPAVTGIDRMVLDQTGLKGNYGFTLKFAPAGSANADLERPELFTAVQEQLGLKLEPTRAPIDVLVIDSVERPTPN